VRSGSRGAARQAELDGLSSVSDWTETIRCETVVTGLVLILNPERTFPEEPIRVVS